MSLNLKSPPEARDESRRRLAGGKRQRKDKEKTKKTQGKDKEKKRKTQGKDKKGKT